MKTWKHLAISGLITLASWSGFLNSSANYQRELHELDNLRNQPKLEQLYSLKEKSKTLTETLHEKTLSAIELTDPNYSEQRKKIFQGSLDIYNDYCTTQNQLEGLLEDKELQRLIQAEKLQERKLNKPLSEMSITEIAYVIGISGGVMFGSTYLLYSLLLPIFNSSNSKKGEKIKCHQNPSSSPRK